MRKLALIFIFLVTACADTDPVKIGKDTYTISTRVPFSGMAGAKGETLQEAAAFCTSQGKEMLLQHTQACKCAYMVAVAKQKLNFTA